MELYVQYSMFMNQIKFGNIVEIFCILVDILINLFYPLLRKLSIYLYIFLFLLLGLSVLASCMLCYYVHTEVHLLYLPGELKHLFILFVSSNASCLKVYFALY